MLSTAFLTSQSETSVWLLEAACQEWLGVENPNNWKTHICLQTKSTDSVRRSMSAISSQRQCGPHEEFNRRAQPLGLIRVIRLMFSRLTFESC